MQSESGAKKYLPASATIIQDLASKFPDDELDIDEIHLDQLTSKERKIILDLTKQIYDFVDVQFYASHMPSWGQCIGDPMWHTKAPV